MVTTLWYFFSGHMYVDQLSLKNYRGFSSAEFSFRPGVNVLFGPNGSGKSSVLEALMMMLSWHVARLKSASGVGKPFQEKQIANEAPYARVKMDLKVEDSLLMQTSLVKKRGGFESHEEVSDLRALAGWATPFRERRTAGEAVRYPLMAFYGVHRAVLDIPLRIRTKHHFDEPLTGYDATFEGGSHFRSFFEWFREREDWENENRLRVGLSYRDACLECVRRTWERFMPELKDFHIHRSPLAFIVSKGERVLEVSQLSDGEKCLLALVGDLARRLAILNKGVTSEEMLESKGIVLIDELDLHLHPLWQRRAIRNLSQVFPQIQFIVTTHSPEMISELDAERITDVACPERPPVMGRGLSSSEVLEFLMKGDVWPEDIRQMIDKIKSLLDDDQVEEARRKFEEMKGLLPQNAPILSALETEIELFA